MKQPFFDYIQSYFAQNDLTLGEVSPEFIEDINTIFSDSKIYLLEPKRWIAVSPSYTYSILAFINDLAENGATYQLRVTRLNHV